MPVSGYSLNAIAKRLSHHRSTITRKINRNCLTRGGYSPLIAQRRYLEHRQRPLPSGKGRRLEQICY